MSNMSLIGGIYLLIMFTGIRLFVVIKRFPNNKDRLVGLFAFPKNMDRRDEWLLIFAQLMALVWIILGIVLRIFPLEAHLRTIPFGGLLGYLILMSPVILLIVILRLLSLSNR